LRSPEFGFFGVVPCTRAVGQTPRFLRRAAERRVSPSAGVGAEAALYAEVGHSRPFAVTASPRKGGFRPQQRLAQGTSPLPNRTKAMVSKIRPRPRKRRKPAPLQESAPGSVCAKCPPIYGFQTIVNLPKADYSSSRGPLAAASAGDWESLHGGMIGAVVAVTTTYRRSHLPARRAALVPCLLARVCCPRRRQRRGRSDRASSATVHDMNTRHGKDGSASSHGSTRSGPQRRYFATACGASAPAMIDLDECF